VRRAADLTDDTLMASLRRRSAPRRQSPRTAEGHHAPAERSSVVLEVELPAERVQRSVDESVRHLARRTKVPGFRPGKAPRPLLERALGVRRDDPDAPNPLYDDAKEHLFEQSVLQAVEQEELDVLSIPSPSGSLRRGRRGLPRDAAAAAGGQAGRLRDYPFKIEIEEIDARADRQGHRQLRDQQATWCRSRTAARRRATTPSSASSAGVTASRSRARRRERMPLVIGNESG
jgi:hypothetical protein